MARTRAAENPRSKSKAVLIEEITRGIGKFRELLAAIADFSQEGFPYRDAARAKAELQLRECVRRIFGERSPEFQTYRNHKLRTSNKAETAQSIAVVKSLILTLEDKKLELQGLKPLEKSAEPPEQNTSSQPQMTLVPPTTPTAQITIAPPQAGSTAPMTLSVAMTTNLGAPVPPASATPHAPPPFQESQAPAAPIMASIQPSPISSAPVPSSSPSPSPIAPFPDGRTARKQPAAPLALAPLTTQAHEASRSNPVLPAYAPSQQEESSAIQTAVEPRSTQPRPEQDPLELLRKVCLRFHAVARQLRLRKDYRTTLEVEDDYDLQDLLCALLKVEFEEVGADEWTPPYTGGAPRTTLLLDRERIAVVAKKTRPGLTTKELADQVAADSTHYNTRDKCTTLFFFIYDPEGRIGSPKRLETDLTSVSDRYVIEVLVAPK